VGVEKLASGKLAKNAMRQNALQTIFSGRLDIFVSPEFALIF
jgi:hypothetical protein